MKSTLSRYKIRLLLLDRLEQRTLLTAGLTALGNQYWHQDLDSIADVGENLDEFGRAVVAGDFNADGFQDLAIGVPGESVDDLIEAGAVHVIYGSSGGLISVASQFWSQGSTDIVADLEAGDRFGAALAVGDFNGDNIDDLAIGAPRESVDGLADAGGVNVIYGRTSFGLTSLNNQFWTQRETVGDLEAGDRFGQAVAAGDFNQDGFDDLAVGAPLDSIAGVAGAGGVNVIYGSADGLTATGNQFWSQNSTDILGDVGADDGFGTSLAVGDFNRDNFGDLAIGVPGDTVNAQPAAGASNVLYGSVNGLAAFANQLWHRDVEGILGDAQTGDQFGQALAAADFDRDGHADLAIGVPGERVNGVNSAGGVNVIYGTTLLGLTDIGDQLWHQDDVFVGLPIANSRFGRSLATGDFDASLPLTSRHDDLAIGGNGANDTGIVNVLYGTNLGLDNFGAQAWQQGTLDDGEVVQGEARPSEQFGAAIAAGDFDNNGFSDLAVGVPRDTVDNISDRIGAVNVLYGFNVIPAPIVVDDAASTGRSSPVMIDVLANDSDPDGSIDPTSVTVTNGPTNGQTSVDAVTGVVEYVPDDDFFGIDQFRYTVRDDSDQESEEATVTVTVAGWWNPGNPFDVNNDGDVVPFDALAVINELNEPTIIDATGRIQLTTKDPESDFLDVNGDNFVVPLDALMVINVLNNPDAGLPAVRALGAAALDRFNGWPSQEGEPGDVESDTSHPLPAADSMPTDLRLIDAVFEQDEDRDVELPDWYRCKSTMAIDFSLMETDGDWSNGQLK